MNGESNHDNVISVLCSECQSGEKTGAGKAGETMSLMMVVSPECQSNGNSNKRE